MKKYVLLILLFGVFVAGFAQQKKNNMETIFEKQLNDHLKIQQVRTTQDNGWNLETILTNKKIKKQVTIDASFIKKGFDDEPMFARLGKMPSYSFSEIISAYLKDKNLFTLQADMCELFFKCFIFKDRLEFEKKQYSLGIIPVRSSAGIPVGYKHEFKWYNNQLFFYVCGEQFGKREYLCFYDTKDDVLNKIEFSETPKEIPDEKRIFREMDFEKPDSYIKISKTIESVLVESGKINPNPKFTFKYLWCFDLDNYSYGTRVSDITYFFYQEDYPYSKVKVIRYDNGKFVWLLDDYREQIIESVK